jgi:hypothetical protein
MNRNTGGLGGVIRAAQNAESMRELREQLDSLVFASCRTIKRTEIITLLTIITGHLSPILEDIEYTPSLEIHKEHNSIGQLKNTF